MNYIHIQIKGSRASGKTVLANLIADYLRQIGFSVDESRDNAKYKLADLNAERTHQTVIEISEEDTLIS